VIEFHVVGQICFWIVTLVIEAPIFKAIYTALLAVWGFRLGFCTVQHFVTSADVRRAL
jgi:hypothetical protein